MGHDKSHASTHQSGGADQVDATGLTGAGASGSTPAPVLSTSNVAGNATTFLRTNDQLALFDATVPTTATHGDSAATGSAALAARRDHAHALVNLSGDVTTSGSNATTIATAAVTGPKLSVVPSVRPNVNALLAWSEDPSLLGTARTPAAATIYLRKIMVPTTIAFTNILVSESTAGNSYTNAQLGLYSSAGTLLGSSAVQASAGTNGFGASAPNIVTLPLTVVGGQSLTVTGGEAVFVWAAIHFGTNSATAAIFQGPGASFTTANAGLAVSAIRAGTYTGHATNPLATIGNLTPASIVNNTSTSLIWMGIT